MKLDVTIPQEAAHDAQVIMAGEYDIPLSEPPRTILDIGGNVGLFSIWAAKKWRKANITAFEPWPDNAKMFRANTEQIPTIVLREVAVLGKAYKSKSMRAGRNAMCRSFHTKEGKAVKVQCIDAETLTADFVKIDAEGSEVEILKRMDLRKVKAVAVESHTPKNTEAIVSIMAKAGLLQCENRESVNGCRLMKFVREPAKRKIFVALPIDNGEQPEFRESLDYLAANAPCQLVRSEIRGDSLVCRARNTLAAQFLRSDASHLLFLDSDLIFAASHIKRLLDHGEEFVSGFYPKKQQSLEWVCNALDLKAKPDKRGLIPMRYMGTGFMLIARSVFERMIANYPEIEYVRDNSDITEWDFFSVGVYNFRNGTRRYLSEDWYFCQRCLDMGLKVWGDTKVIAKHIGRAIYPLDSELPKLLPAKKKKCRQNSTTPLPTDSTRRKSKSETPSP